MKELLTIFILGFGLIGFGQDSTKTCNQLPYAKVDVKAKEVSNLNEEVQNSLPKELKKGDHKAAYKLTVDCHGSVSKQQYTEGNLKEKQQKWLSELIGKTEWKPAQVKEKEVSSTLFITFQFTNGKVKIEIRQL